MYVFGIDLPLPELMFIYTLLLVLGLLVTLIEIRRLRKLILRERADIYRFEADIDKLNPKDKEKHSKILDHFIKKSLGKGMTKTEIEEILIEKGWPKDMVYKTFKKWRL